VAEAIDTTWESADSSSLPHVDQNTVTTQASQHNIAQARQPRGERRIVGFVRPATPRLHLPQLRVAPPPLQASMHPQQLQQHA
jgi:hypothetical protein